MAASMINNLVKSFGLLKIENPCVVTQRFKAYGSKFKQYKRGSRLTPPTSTISVRYVNPQVKIKKYSLHPVRLHKTGGRGPDGAIAVHGHGGGHKQRLRQIDFKRHGKEDGSTLVEKVLAVRYDPCRTADIAVVACGEKARYILASENMKAGDLIESTNKLSGVIVKPVDGNAYPVGALPIGTIVHNIERYAGLGGRVSRAAGSCGQIIRQLPEQSIIAMPSKREMVISVNCVATVGRVSNVGQAKKPIGSAGRNRWFGKRPNSGYYQKKDGYHGRKINPPKKPIEYDIKKPRGKPSAVYRLTF
ncbi:hypothetical protein LOTGIDRAFT_213398 [Lottia gigantea]|uniref:Uncharacterized protein n=1 Tax=Lottia gigantea TaxID=225164 RepID=V4AWN6_LOTGI|nr:hypothetical protein LOTGIDRAFT_213398 [Lottia gigantea]ESO99420.1 hypothetical protein LOTGIDRAFT_213398 [Lottia gigantea]